MKGTTVVLLSAAILTAIVAMPVPAQAQGMMGPGVGRGPQAQVQTSGPVAIDQAVALVQQALSRLGNPDLVPVEIMEFTGNFYVLVAAVDP